MESLFGDGGAGIGGDFHEHATGDAFEASGAQWRGEDLAVLDREDVGGGALADFAAFVEQDNFIAAFALRFGEAPDAIDPGDGFYAGKSGSGVEAVFANAEAGGVRSWVDVGAGDDQVHFGHFFVALPGADGIPNQIDARATVQDFVGANDFLQVHADFCAGVGHGQAGARGVFFEAAPVALVGEGFALQDAHGGEETPAADQAGLSGRPANFLEWPQLFIVKDLVMNHTRTYPVPGNFGTRSIVPEGRTGMSCGELR